MENRRNGLSKKSDNYLVHLAEIAAEDLDYVEKDLCFADKVSMTFLLYGENHVNAVYGLQKLLILAGVRNSNSVTNCLSISSLPDNSNILRQYAILHPLHWRTYIIESLVIINARRVLRKLGFRWEELRQHYLPHISALSLHVHPLLKALYTICESLTAAEAGRLVMYIDDKYKRNNNEHLRFYDFDFLEVYLLSWLTRHIIKLGDINTDHCEMQPLIEYFKLNDMQTQASLLIDTINSNVSNPGRINNRTVRSDRVSDDATSTLSVSAAAVEGEGEAAKAAASPAAAAQSTVESTSNTTNTATILSQNDRYIVRRESAGIVLIINQQKFHRNVSADLKSQIADRSLSERDGTNADKERLTHVFSQFGYNIEAHDDLDHIEMLRTIREVVQRSLLNDSLIVCILSHGIDGAIYAANSVPLKISDIECIINGSDTLEKKPKMVIIQACQKSDKKRNAELRNNTNRVLDAQDYADMLKAMSTVPGYESIRHTKSGTWFIQALCEQIEKYGSSKHMLDILTAVIDNVSNQRGNNNEVMLPVTCSTLRRNFYLPESNTK